MRKIFQATLLILCMVPFVGIADSYFERIPLSVFTQTGRVTIAANGTSASAVLASSSASSPIATTAVVQNLGSTLAYVELGAASNVTATTTGSYPIQPQQIAVLALRNARYAAAISAGSAVSISISTGY